MLKLEIKRLRKIGLNRVFFFSLLLTAVLIGVFSRLSQESILLTSLQTIFYSLVFVTCVFQPIVLHKTLDFDRKHHLQTKDWQYIRLKGLACLIYYGSVILLSCLFTSIIIFLKLIDSSHFYQSWEFINNYLLRFLIMIPVLLAVLLAYNYLIIYYYINYQNKRLLAIVLLVVTAYLLVFTFIICAFIPFQLLDLVITLAQVALVISIEFFIRKLIKHKKDHKGSKYEAI